MSVEDVSSRLRLLRILRPHLCGAVRPPATPLRQEQQQPPKPLRGGIPSRQQATPNLPRFACADLRCATPFPLPLRSRCKGGDTLGLQLLPHLRQEAFGMYVPATCPFKGKRKGNSPTGGTTMKKPSKVAQSVTVNPSTTAA